MEEYITYAFLLSYKLWWNQSFESKNIPSILFCIIIIAHLHVFAFKNLIDVMKIDPLNLIDLGAEVKL